MLIVLVAASFFSLPAFADNAVRQRGEYQVDNPTVRDTTNVRDLLAMGPDPGGHTGATVTPETTKTGQPAVDSAREAASGGKTKNSGPSIDSSRQSKK